MSTTTPFVRDVVRLISTPAFCRYAERLLPGEGDDLRQDVLVRVLKHEARGGATPSSLTAWLSTAMRHTAFSSLSARKVATRVAVLDPAMALDFPGLCPIGKLGGEGLIAASLEADAEATVLDDLDRRDALDQLAEAIEDLPTPQRRAIELTLFEGVPARDTARQGAPFGSVVSRISRAKDALAGTLGAAGRAA